MNFSNFIEKFCHENPVKIGYFNSHHEIKLDRDFSLFENPNRVLLNLREMFEYARKKNKFAKLKYNGHGSFGALYLIDSMCWEIARAKKWTLDHRELPREELVILSKLKSFASSSYEDSKGYMINEKVHINREDGPMGDQNYKVQVKRITDMLNQAISDQKGYEYELPLEAYNTINSTISEQFDNILLHAPDASFGTLCGFYNKTSREITILIFNYGNTIYETLSMNNLPMEMQEKVDVIISNYRKKQIIFMESKFSVENALTLLAFQEGVSSRLTFDNTRGHGLIDFAENCFELCEDAKIVIISGKTAIKIDNKYKIEKRHVFDRERRVLAFNSTNDLFEKPKSSHVQNLSVYFPGVIIETTIPLNFIK